MILVEVYTPCIYKGLSTLVEIRVLFIDFKKIDHVSKEPFKDGYLTLKKRKSFTLCSLTKKRKPVNKILISETAVSSNDRKDATCILL